MTVLDATLAGVEKQQLRRLRWKPTSDCRNTLPFASDWAALNFC